MAPITTSGLAPMENASGRMMGVTMAGMPHTLPVLKFKSATTAKVMTGNSGALMNGRTALMT